MTSRTIIARAPSRQFMALTIGAGLLLNLLPWSPEWYMPDFLAVILVFWGIHAPGRIGLFAAWALGLLMDIHQGSALGQQALIYASLLYFGSALQRRLSGFSVPGQAAHLAALFALAALMAVLLRWSSDGSLPDASIVILVGANTLCWMATTNLLLGLLSRRARPSRARVGSRARTSA